MTIKSLGSLFALLAINPAVAGQLVYQPVNPSFGGSPLNGSYVLGLASANNQKFLQNPANQPTATNAAQQFKSQITSALLSQIASNVSQQILGENAKSSGSFNFAGELVTFNRADGNININITDATTGAQTQIVIPAPTF